jgi:hypothetical protein
MDAFHVEAPFGKNSSPTIMFDGAKALSGAHASPLDIHREVF